MSSQFVMSTPARRLAAAWFTLALTALGLSAVFAVILVVARTPFLGQGAALFRTALVLHVDLAVQVWFLSMAAGIWSLAVEATNPLRWIAFVLALAGTITMVCAPLTGAATPILSNYVPLLDNPVFMAGLGVFAIGAGLTGLVVVAGLRRDVLAPWHLAANFAALALFATTVVVVLDFLAAPAPNLGSINIDDRLWGVGHGIQFVHILLLMGAWCTLGNEAIARVPALRRALPWIFCMALIPALAAPVIPMTHPVGTAEYRDNFTALMRWGSWPGAAVLGLALVTGLLRIRRERRRLTAEETGLALSLFLFGVGCLLGATIRGESLAVPAHYHGTVGAVTLAYLLWLRRLAPDLGIAAEHLSKTRKLPLYYGAGILILVGGLAAAGYLGIPRKAAHVDIGVDTAAYFAAMGMAGVGGFIALSAVAAIVAIGLCAAWRTRFPSTPAATRRHDVRPWAIAATVLLVIAGGWLLELLPGSGPRTFSPYQHGADKISADIKLRFEQGVVMLHAKQYEHALTAFHRVMQLAPEMPEAYVNTGFALLGMKRYKEAGDFFESATQLRRSQVNAYYGLAVALEGIGDLPGALGAMETYVHLTKAEDPFRHKAEAAIWEWRSTLEGGKAEQRSDAR